MLLDITSLPDVEPLSQRVRPPACTFDTGSPQAVQPCSFHLRPISTPQPEGQPAPLHDGRAFGQLQPVLPCLQSTSVLHALPSLRCERGTPAPPSRAARALQERSLCAAERYLPAQYLAIKATVLKLQETRGRVPRGEMLKLPFQASRPCTALQYIACPSCISLAGARIEDGCCVNFGCCGAIYMVGCEDEKAVGPCSGHLGASCPPCVSPAAGAA